MSDIKQVHFNMPRALYEEFFRMFPGHGERGAFLNRVVSIAVEDREELEEYLRRAVFEAVAGEDGE